MRKALLLIFMNLIMVYLKLLNRKSLTVKGKNMKYPAVPFKYDWKK